MIFFTINLSVFALIFWKLSNEKELGKWLKRNNSSTQGNLLFEQLMRLGSFSSKGHEKSELSQYKFFTKIVESLQSSLVRYGTSLHAYLPKIKKALINDLRFEKKIKSELLGGLLQMVTVQAFCFIFVGCLYIQLSLSFTYSSLIVPLLIQALGYTLFIFIFFKIKKKMFAPLERYIETFYLISTLLFAKIPIGRIHEECKISTLPMNKELDIFKQRVSIIFQEIKRCGTIQEQEMEISIDELWFLFEYKFDSFLKHLAALKLIIIVFFFLSSFMLILMEVLGGLQL
jgi:hypothetical protein